MLVTATSSSKRQATYGGFLDGAFLEDGLDDFLLRVCAELVVEGSMRRLIICALRAMPVEEA